MQFDCNSLAVLYSMAEYGVCIGVMWHILMLEKDSITELNLDSQRFGLTCEMTVAYVCSTSRQPLRNVLRLCNKPVSSVSTCSH